MRIEALQVKGMTVVHQAFSAAYLPVCQAMGDAAVIMRLSESRNSLPDGLLSVAQMIERAPASGVLDWNLGYDCVAVYFDPAVTNLSTMTTWLQSIYTSACVQGKTDTGLTDAEAVEIPVCYGKSFGPDLAEVAAHTHCKEGTVIRRHTAALYRVAMIGFAPGFPYLSGMDERLATPRKSIPRRVVPAGSVGIAGKQTGIYSFETPGGWQIIGRTPLRFFHPHANPPIKLQPGAFVRFRAVTEEEFDAIERTEAE